jgi:hypothetical protein
MSTAFLTHAEVLVSFISVSFERALGVHRLKQQLARNPGMMAALAITMSHLKAISTAFEATGGESDDSPVLIMDSSENRSHTRYQRRPISFGRRKNDYFWFLKKRRPASNLVSCGPPPALV